MKNVSRFFIHSKWKENDDEFVDGRVIAYFSRTFPPQKNLSILPYDEMEIQQFNFRLYHTHTYDLCVCVERKNHQKTPCILM
jgi:hypothetical protein